VNPVVGDIIDLFFGDQLKRVTVQKIDGGYVWFTNGHCKRYSEALGFHL
jgi:hypothetical protein